MYYVSEFESYWEDVRKLTLNIGGKTKGKKNQLYKFPKNANARKPC
jgi:hypothetical protein